MVRRSLPFVLACTLLAGARQDDGQKLTREFLEGLSSADPAVREATVHNLKKLGEVARPILNAAAKEADPEVSSRAKFLLRRIDAAAKIPQGTTRIGSALLDRIAERGPSGWGDVFIHLADLPDIPRRDLDRIVPLAFEAPTAEQYGALCDAASKRECRAAIPFLVSGLESEQQEVRDAAVRTLTELKAVEAETALKGLLAEGPTPVRTSAMVALRDIFEIDADPLFVPLLRDADPEIVTAALQGLEDHPSATVPPEVLRPLLAHPFSSVRYHTLEVLRKWKVGAAASWVLPLLGDRDSEVRQTAALALEYAGSPVPVPGLRKLLTDPEPEVREAAISSLSKLEDRESIPKFQSILGADHETASVRAEAAEALAHLKAKEAVDLGLSLLAHADSQIRRAAATLVGETVGPPSSKNLGPLLRDPDLQVREAVTKVFEGWKSPDLVPAVLPALEDADPDIRNNAVTLLGKLGGAAAVAELGSRLDDPTRETASLAAWALTTVDAPGVRPWLNKLLKNDDQQIRSAALRRLWALKGTDSAEDAAGLVADADGPVRMTAIDVLAMAERPQDLPAFARALADDNPLVRASAKGALARQLERPTREGLLGLLAGASETVRNRALAEVGLDPVDRSLKDLVAKWAEEDPDAPTDWTVEILRRGVDPKEVTALLIPLLKDERSSARAVALDGISLFGSHDAAAAIRPLLGDPEPRVREAAAFTLAELGDREAGPSILKLLDDSRLESRVGVCRALGILGVRDASEQLRTMIGEEASPLEWAAIEALAMMGAADAVPAALGALDRSPTIAGSHLLDNEVLCPSEALGRFPAGEVAPQLLSRLKHRYAPIRAGAAAGLGALGHRDAIPDLLRLLEDLQPFVRTEAARSLARLGASQAVGPLRRMVDREAVGTTGEYPPEGGVAAPAVAIQALRRLGAVEAVPELLKALRSAHGEIRGAAFDAIGKLRLKSQIPEVLKIVSDRDLYVEDGLAIPPGRRGRVPANLGFGGVWVDSGIGDSVFFPDVVAAAGAVDYVPDLVRLLPWLVSSERRSVAASLARLGSREGAPILLRAAAWGEETDLWALNALRKPAPWARLEAARFKGTRAWRKSEVWAELGALLGTRCEVPRRMWRGSLSWTRNDDSVCGLTTAFRLEEDGTALEALRSLCGTVYSFILEDDRLRVVRNDEALAFWRDWARDK